MEGVQMAGDETERLEILPNPFKVILTTFEKFSLLCYFLIDLGEHNVEN